MNIRTESKQVSLFDQLGQWVWYFLLLTIPVTSFPPIADRLGEDVAVSPLALLPLALLLPLWVVPRLLRQQRLSVVVWPLFAFVMAAILASLIAWFSPPVAWKGQTILLRELRALATLVFGLGFFGAAVTMVTDRRSLRITLLAVTIGGVLTLLWSSVQAEYVLRGLNNVPQNLNDFHRLFSIRDLHRDRVTGFAFEPSWLGDQIVVVYLPLWIGAVFKRQSVLPFRLGPLTLELLLIVWSAAILLLTRSRVSLLAVLAVTGGLLLYGAWRVTQAALGRLGLASRGGRWLKLGIQLAAVAAIVLAMVAVGVGLIRLGATVDWRMRRVLRLPTEIAAITQEYPYASIYEVANRFAFAERLVYWRAGLQGFLDYPLLGVGLGNAGFYFEEGVPAYGTELVEIRNVLEPGFRIFPNPKNLWIRLLSETGLVGFSLYLTWVSVLGVGAAATARLGKSLYGWLGLAALLSLTAQVMEWLSLDTFALPQSWIMNGLLAAVLLSTLETDRRHTSATLQSAGVE